jgi:hypothetical protein
MSAYAQIAIAIVQANARLVVWRVQNIKHFALTHHQKVLNIKSLNTALERLVSDDKLVIVSCGRYDFPNRHIDTDWNFKVNRLVCLTEIYEKGGKRALMRRAHWLLGVKTWGSTLVGAEFLEQVFKVELGCHDDDDALPINYDGRYFGDNGECYNYPDARSFDLD